LLKARAVAITAVLLLNEDATDDGDDDAVTMAVVAAERRVRMMTVCVNVTDGGAADDDEEVAGEDEEWRAGKLRGTPRWETKAASLLTRDIPILRGRVKKCHECSSCFSSLAVAVRNTDVHEPGSVWGS
jgi:hypothetical protein